jgi:26S proteasome regulatory subunit N1
MPPKDKDAVELTAGSAETKKKEKESKTAAPTAEDTLSDEDRELRERLDTCVDTVINAQKEASVTTPLKMKALDVIVNELRTATASMTSVPKPLKFLRPRFADIKTCYEELQQQQLEDNKDSILELRARLADVLSVLAMTMGKHEGRPDLRNHGAP